MKRGQIILLVSLVLGGCMFICSRLLLHKDPSAAGGEELAYVEGSMLPELEWLRQWLHLSDDQFEQVKALHLAYLPKCRLNCARIGAAEAELLEAVEQPEEELNKRLQALTAAQIECRQAMIGHVRKTAGCLNEEQARQYLDTMLPQVLGLGRSCAACLQHPH